MDAKYLACLVLFLSFTVITGEDHEYMAANSVEPSVVSDTREAADCSAIFHAEQTSPTGATASSGAAKATVKSGGAVTEGVLKNLSCLLASI